jgi:hypothetical protein
MSPRTKLNLWISLALVGMLSAFVWVQSTPETTPQGLISRVPADFAKAVKGDSKRGVAWERVSAAFIYGGVVHVPDKTGFVHAREYKPHPVCAFCGFKPNPCSVILENRKRLQAHHGRTAFKDMTPEQKGTDEPGGEYDENNLIALCERHPENHHLNIGHDGNFKHENPNVFEDCKANEAKLRKLGTWGK